MVAERHMLIQQEQEAVRARYASILQAGPKCLLASSSAGDNRNCTDRPAAHEGCYLVLPTQRMHRQCSGCTVTEASMLLTASLLCPAAPTAVL